MYAKSVEGRARVGTGPVHFQSRHREWGLADRPPKFPDILSYLSPVVSPGPRWSQQLSVVVPRAIEVPVRVYQENIPLDTLVSNSDTFLGMGRLMFTWRPTQVQETPGTIIKQSKWGRIDTAYQTISAFASFGNVFLDVFLSSAGGDAYTGISGIWATLGAISDSRETNMAAVRGISGGTVLDVEDGGVHIKPTAYVITAGAVNAGGREKVGTTATQILKWPYKGTDVVVDVGRYHATHRHYTSIAGFPIPDKRPLIRYSSTGSVPVPVEKIDFGGGHADLSLDEEWLVTSQRIQYDLPSQNALRERLATLNPNTASVMGMSCTVTYQDELGDVLRGSLAVRQPDNTYVSYAQEKPGPPQEWVDNNSWNQALLLALAGHVSVPE
jgi:hypothetical protein